MADIIVSSGVTSTGNTIIYPTNMHVSDGGKVISTTVICDGRILMRGGCVDGEDEIIAEAREAAKRLTSK